MLMPAKFAEVLQFLLESVGSQHLIDCSVVVGYEEQSVSVGVTTEVPATTWTCLFSSNEIQLTEAVARRVSETLLRRTSRNGTPAFPLLSTSYSHNRSALVPVEKLPYFAGRWA